MERSNDDHSRKKEFKGVETLVSLDPTPRSEYLDWICRTYVGQSFLIEDADRVSNTLTIFHRFKRRLPVAQRDIGRIKNEQDLWEIVERFIPHNGEEEPVEGKELKRQEKATAISESDILESTDLEGWIVASPVTHFAARWWSRGTRWCTGMKNPAHFNRYAINGPLRVFISPSGDKFQAHIATFTFCDAADRQIDKNKFLSSIPKSALELLQGDVIQSFDNLGNITTIPALLRSEGMIEKAKKAGFDKAVTIAENKGGYALKFLPSMLSMWAYGLAEESDFRRGEQRADIALFHGGEVLARYFVANHYGIALGNEIKKTADVEFIQQAANGMMCLWEKNSIFAEGFLVGVKDAFAEDFFTQKTWDVYFAQASKKQRGKSVFEIKPDVVTDEMANALARHNLLTILPLSLVTPERVDIFVSETPEHISRITHIGLDHMISDEAIKQAARWKKGKGLAFIPFERLNQELFRSVVEEFPTAICHVDERYLTTELIDRVVCVTPNVVFNIPKRFVTEELLIKAVSIQGNLYQQLKPEWRTPSVTEVALRVSPNVFVNTDCELTYQQFLDGVALSGSTLSRVPLIYRTIEMCEAALSFNISEAISHVPPPILKTIKQKVDANTGTLFEEKIRNWNRPISKRYAASDPIHSFYPDEATILPERLKKLMHGDKTEIYTDPEGLLVRDPEMKNAQALAMSI
jgi:hypothetical protein